MHSANAVRKVIGIVNRNKNTSHRDVNKETEVPIAKFHVSCIEPYIQ